MIYSYVNHLSIKKKWRAVHNLETFKVLLRTHLYALPFELNRAWYLNFFFCKLMNYFLHIFCVFSLLLCSTSVQLVCIHVVIDIDKEKTNQKVIPQICQSILLLIYLKIKWKCLRGLLFYLYCTFFSLCDNQQMRLFLVFLQCP